MHAGLCCEIGSSNQNEKEKTRAYGKTTTATAKPEKKRAPRRNKFVYNWNLVIYPYNLLVVSVCGAISNVIFNLLFFAFAVASLPRLFFSACMIVYHTRARAFTYREPSLQQQPHRNISMG